MTSTDENQNESAQENSSNVPTDDTSNEPYRQFTQIEKAMMSQMLSINEDTTSERKRLEDLIRNVKEYQDENPFNAKVHLFVTCPNNSSGIEEEGKFHLFTMVSNLFHTALKASTPGNTTSAQGIQDAFLLSRHFVTRRNDTVPTSNGPLQHAVMPVVSIVPSWFPWEGRGEGAVDSHSCSHSRIVCRDEVMNVLTRCTVKKISDAYAKFFTKLWLNAFQQKLIPKQISYSSLTPPWLREHVVFIYGISKNVSIPFTRSSLPTKHQVRESGQKQLACAIIDTWLQSEMKSAAELLSILSLAGINLPVEIISGSRNGDDGQEHRGKIGGGSSAFNS